MSSLGFCSDFVPRASSALGHLDAHVAVVKDPTLRIDRRRADDVALVVVAQLPGYPDGIAYPRGLSVPVRLLRGHPESPCLLWDWHTALPRGRLDGRHLEADVRQPTARSREA